MNIVEAIQDGDFVPDNLFYKTLNKLKKANILLRELKGAGERW